MSLPAAKEVRIENFIVFPRGLKGRAESGKGEQCMRGYKGYVSPSRDGILSDTPGASGYDTVPDPHGASLSAIRLSDSAQTDFVCRDAAHEDLPPEDRSCAVQAGRKGTGFWSSLSCLCRGRILALALAVNCLLVLFFALIMYLDRPVPPKYVFYIDLVDGSHADDAGREHEKQDKSEGPAEKSLPQEQTVSH